ncbi:hypothetical protein Tco_0899862 [Tanacetum coccineum]
MFNEELRVIKENMCTGSQGKMVTCYNCRGQRHVARECEEKKRAKDSQWFKDKALLMEAKEKGAILDAEAEAFLADVECTTPYSEPLAITTTTEFKTGPSTGQGTSNDTDFHSEVRMYISLWLGQDEESRRKWAMLLVLTYVLMKDVFDLIFSGGGDTDGGSDDEGSATTNSIMHTSIDGDHGDHLRLTAVGSTGDSGSSSSSSSHLSQHSSSSSSSLDDSLSSLSLYRQDVCMILLCVFLKFLLHPLRIEV